MRLASSVLIAVFTIMTAADASAAAALVSIIYRPDIVLGVPVERARLSLASPIAPTTVKGEYCMTPTRLLPGTVNASLFLSLSLSHLAFLKFRIKRFR